MPRACSAPPARPTRTSTAVTADATSNARRTSPLLITTSPPAGNLPFRRHRARARASVRRGQRDRHHAQPGSSRMRVLLRGHPDLRGDALSVERPGLVLDAGDVDGEELLRLLL